MTYSIIIAELPAVAAHFAHAAITRAHCYLALAKRVEEGPLGLVAVDEIHFLSDEVFRYRKVYESCAPELFNTSVHECVTGDEKEIKALWDKAVKAAEKMTEMDIPFDTGNLPETHNCRAGVIAILKHLDLEYTAPDRVMDESGTDADLYERIQHRL